jgi:hypothetical protein
MQMPFRCAQSSSGTTPHLAQVRCKDSTASVPQYESRRRATKLPRVHRCPALVLSRASSSNDLLCTGVRLAQERFLSAVDA